MFWEDTFLKRWLIIYCWKTSLQNSEMSSFFAFSDVECGRNKSKLFECPSWKWTQTKRNTHWTWAERTYGRQQQIIWAVFFQTNYIAQTLVKETRDNIADLIIWTTSIQSFGVVSTLSFYLFCLTIFCQFCQVVHKYLLIEWFLDRVMVEVLGTLCASRGRVIPSLT